MNTTSKESTLHLIRQRNSAMMNDQGFTMIELIMVVAIVAILASLSLNSVYELRDKARQARAAEEIRGLEKDVIAYAAERGTYPPDLAAVNQGALKDPWGRLYVYNLVPTRTYSGKPINTDFDIYSKGIDGISPDPSIALPGCKDDIVRGNDGGYSGLADLYGT